MDAPIGLYSQGIAGIVILLLTRACWVLYTDNKRLQDSRFSDGVKIIKNNERTIRGFTKASEALLKKLEGDHK